MQKIRAQLAAGELGDSTGDSDFQNLCLPALRKFRPAPVIAYEQPRYFNKIKVLYAMALQDEISGRRFYQTIVAQ
jgi:hypothetical protein